MAPAIALSCCIAGIVSAFSCAVEARTGLAPVVADATLGVGYARAVEQAIRNDLRLRGVDTPAPKTILPHLGLASPTDAPTTAQCVAAGKKMGLDLLLLIRIRNVHAGTRLMTELRAVVVETGEEYRFDRQTLLSYAERAPKRLVVSDVRSLVSGVMAEVRAWEPDLIDVERAFKRDYDEEYLEYQTSNTSPELSFADTLYLRADKRMRDGKIVAIVVPAILAAATTVALTAGFKPWTWDDHDDEQCDPACLSVGLGRMMITAGFVLVAVVGYGATIATLALALRAYTRGKREVGALRPLVPVPPVRPEPEFELAFAPYAAPGGGGLALDLRF